MKDQVRMVLGFSTADMIVVGETQITELLRKVVLETAVGQVTAYWCSGAGKKHPTGRFQVQGREFTKCQSRSFSAEL